MDIAGNHRVTTRIARPRPVRQVHLIFPRVTPDGIGFSDLTRDLPGLRERVKPALGRVCIRHARRLLLNAYEACNLSRLYGSRGTQSPPVDGGSHPYEQ